MIKKLLSLIEVSNGVTLLFVLISFGAIIELLSFGSLIPIIYFLTNQSENEISSFSENLLEDIIAGKKDVVIPTTPIKSYFFIGRSGTGKETTVKAIARELNLTLYSVSAKKFAKTAGMSIIDCIRFCCSCLKSVI